MSFFKILSESQFHEIKKNAKSWEKYVFTAQILPDRNFIYDMLHDYSAHWDIIDAGEYEQIENLLANKK